MKHNLALCFTSLRKVQLKKSSSVLVVTSERPRCGSGRGTDAACPDVPGFQYIVTFRPFSFLQKENHTKKEFPTWSKPSRLRLPSG